MKTNIKKSTVLKHLIREIPKKQEEFSKKDDLKQLENIEKELNEQS